MGHTRHFFATDAGAPQAILDAGPFTHLRLRVFPDGGVSRLRAFGRLTEAARGDAAARLLATSSPRDLASRLHACCASSKFVATLTKERPFSSGAALFARAREVVGAFGEGDVLEAVAGHPRIGERPPEARADGRFSAEEQSRAKRGPAETLAAIADANRAYEAKHGFVFLIYATGKTADEILAAARERLQNTREAELAIAARELAEITALRLRKLVG